MELTSTSSSEKNITVTGEDSAHRLFKEEVKQTPAFIVDEHRITHHLSLLNNIKSSTGCKVLYSVKALPFESILNLISQYTDGFSVSSLFEARLAHEVLAGHGSLHLTTPGLRQEEMNELSNLCDFISFNSLNQLKRLGHPLGGNTSLGLRVNPQLSFLDDPRYDPCRRHSKLGAPLSELKQMEHRHGALKSIEGLHFHTMFESHSFVPLQQSMRHIEQQLPELMTDLEWINLGGGYLLEKNSELEGLRNLVDNLRNKWHADVYFEPGKAIVNNAGYLVSSVIDRFESDGKTIAVLDTSVNHLPGVFEYQTQPTLADTTPDGTYPIILAGCTCLSGDLFGEYLFPHPLTIGNRVIFKKVGAYSLIKASRFNGQNLPSIYTYHQEQGLKLVKRYDYEDYRQQWVE